MTDPIKPAPPPIPTNNQKSPFPNRNDPNQTESGDQTVGQGNKKSNEPVFNEEEISDRLRTLSVSQKDDPVGAGNEHWAEEARRRKLQAMGGAQRTK